MTYQQIQMWDLYYIASVSISYCQVIPFENMLAGMYLLYKFT